ncbi:hypothetical protein KCU95_g920, partial [Aureobasidium melanogenum]
MSNHNAKDEGKPKCAETTVACTRCRSRKIKASCDGQRPTCSRCIIRQQLCVYTAEPDASPIVSLKRKLDALQKQREEVSQLLDRLKSGHLPALPASPVSVPVYVIDERVKLARARDWDVSYVDDHGFRNIISSYLNWDRHGHRPFDEDDFLDGLIKQPTDTCSEVLVHTILAYGSYNYSHVDPENGPIIIQAAWSRAKELWNGNIDKENSLGSAAAGMIMWSVHTLLTDDNLGLHDVHRAGQVYDPLQPRGSRARAVFAWGIYSWINGRPVPMLKVETFVAQSRLSRIMKDIVPLLKQSSSSLTPDYQKATLVLYQRMQKCWGSIDPALKVLHEAPPHVLYLNALYNSALIELLRPLTATPSHPSPHATLVEGAGLSVEPTLSYATLATRSQRIVYRFVDKFHGQAQVVVLLEAFVVAVAFETLPTYDTSADARLDFLIAFRVIYHGAKQFPVLRYAALGIERAARNMNIVISDEVVAILHLIQEMIAGADQDSGKSKWVVVFNVNKLGSQESRLSSVVDELKQISITGRPDT